MPEYSMLDAVNLALKRAMQENPQVLMLGENVGIGGGVFRATDGLLQTFGPQRVFDTPLSETLIAGMAVGLAAQGFRPIAEIQFMGFIYSALDQMINHASRLRSRTRGRLTCPMVLRAPFGGGVHAPEHHSESTEALFTHVPGLRVVIPFSAEAAYRLLLTAIRDPDPVVFLEPKRLYRAQVGNFSDDGQGMPLDCCQILREGTDISIISWGAALLEVQLAATELAQSGINCEVIDVQTLKPMDSQTIMASIARTGRALIVHEAARTSGFGAEVAARIAESALFYLKAPIQRVTGFDTVMPLAKLESRYLPDVARITQAVRQCVAFD